MKSKKEKKKITLGMIKESIRPFFELAEYLFKDITYPIYNKFIRKDRYGVMYSTNNAPFRFEGPGDPTEDFIHWFQKRYKTLEESLAECKKFEKEKVHLNGKAVLYDVFKKEVYKPHRKLFESYEPEYRNK